MKHVLVALSASLAFSVFVSCSSNSANGANAGSGGVHRDGAAGSVASGGVVAAGGATTSGGDARAGGRGGATSLGGAGGATGLGGQTASDAATDTAAYDGALDTGGPTGSGGRDGGGATFGGAGGSASGGIDGGAATGGVVSSGGTSGAGGTGTGGQVILPPGVTALFPAPGSTGICPDPPLRITFAGPPTLGTTGKIQVFTAAGTAVASVDMSAATITDTIGGTTFILLRPVFVDGNSAVVYLKNNALAYGQTYYVTVDAGAIKPPSGTLAIGGTTTWRFTTAAAPPSNLSALSVALDGSGQFCTVQGATDALPAKSTAATTISIAAGAYHEIMHVSNKSNMTLHGADRTKTFIVGTNNNTQQGSAAGTRTRPLLGFDNTNGLVIEDLTIKNLTPQGGSQAEALRLGNCDKCIIRNAEIWSLQDTLLWDGRIYAENSLIVGNVDYVWGGGVAYFNKCELRTVGISGGYVVQARNAAGSYGYVFVDCKLTTDGSSKNNWLARIDASQYPASHVAYINCQMTGIADAGWTITNSSSSLRFWEYQSTDAAGNLLSTSSRAAGSTQLSASQAASMRDPTVVLGGWQP